jgi:LysM repeat protein
LSVIAARFALDLQSLREENGLAEDAVLQVGQELVIPLQKGGPILTPMPSLTSTPDALVHTVKAGDSLSAISVKYDIDMETIAAANGIKVDSTLKIGQELIIPGLKPTLTPTPSPSSTATQMPMPSPRAIASITLAFPYRQPHLLAPIDGEVVEGAETSIVLNWTSVGILGERQWYSLHLWVPGEEAPLRFWTKVPSWRMDPKFYPDVQHGYEFAWQVAVIFRSSGESDGVAISLPSEKRSFSWR